MICAFSEYDKQ